MVLTCNEFVHFTQYHEEFPLIRDIILNQHSITCRDSFNNEYILHCLRVFTHGIMYVTNKAQIEKRIKSKTNKYYLKGFTMFIHDPLSFSIQEKILCSDKNSKGFGKKLMEKVKDFAIENEVDEWRIYSFAEERLKRYYETFGFCYEDTVYKDGKAKVYKMYMKFYYSEDGSAIINKNKNINMRILNIQISCSNSDYIHAFLDLSHFCDQNVTFEDEFSLDKYENSRYPEGVGIIDYSDDFLISENNNNNTNNIYLYTTEDGMNKCVFIIQDENSYYFEGLINATSILGGKFEKI